MPTKEWFEQQKKEALEWSFRTSFKKFCVLDTETTGLKGEVIQIGIIDETGNVLLNQLVKPIGVIEPGAEKAHHITLEMLKDSPTWDVVYPTVKTLIEGKLVIAYNARFDSGILKRTGDLYGLPEIKATWECAMINHAKFSGESEWSPQYNSFSYSKLTKAVESFKLKPNNAHDACSDAIMTLDVIKAMAACYNAGKLYLF